MKTDNLELKSLALLNMAGLSHAPKAGYRPAGNSITGRQIYTSNALATSADVTAGAKLVHVLATFLAPFKVLTKKEKDAVLKIAKTSQDKKLITDLSDEAQNRKINAFVQKILSAAMSNTDHAAGLLSAKKLYDHWGVMSPAQKSLAIVTLGIQTHKTTESGGPVCDLKIISGKDQVFTVQDALDLLKEGKNPYSLVKNWNQIKELHKVFHGKPTPESMADFAHSHGLLAKNSPKDQVIPGANAKNIAQAGAKPAPQYGVGALAVHNNMPAQNGYVTAAQTPTGKVVVPQANAKSAAGAVQGSLIGTEAGNQGISSGAAGVYKKWDKKDAKTKDKGSEGGSALIAGLTALKASNPYLFGALVAFITKYVHKNVASNNPLNYAASLAGIALGRLVSGKVEEQVDKEAVRIANMIHDSSNAEWAKLQINLKGYYASFGVSSKADAYQLSNQAYSEGRINESEIVAMHEIFDFVYDQNGLELVQRLLNGKDRGLEIVREPKDDPKNTMTEHKSKNQKEALASMTKEDLRRKNALRYQKKLNAAEQEADSQGGPAQEEDVNADTDVNPQTGVSPQLPSQQGVPSSDETPTADSSQGLQTGASA